MGPYISEMLARDKPLHIDPLNSAGRSPLDVKPLSPELDKKEHRQPTVLASQAHQACSLNSKVSG